MQILDDPRFYDFKQSTTYSKYFSVHQENKNKPIQNPIYISLKNQQIHNVKNKVNEKQKQNKNRKKIKVKGQIQFMKSKIVQKVKKMNSIIEQKQIRLKSKNILNSKETNKLQILRNSFQSNNELECETEILGKKIKKDKQKLSVLQRYNEKVEEYYRKLKFDGEDKTRKEIADSQEIVNIIKDKPQTNKAKISRSFSGSKSQKTFTISIHQLTAKDFKKFREPLYYEVKMNKLMNQFKKQKQKQIRPQTSKLYNSNKFNSKENGNKNLNFIKSLQTETNQKQCDIIQFYEQSSKNKHYSEYCKSLNQANSNNLNNQQKKRQSLFSQPYKVNNEKVGIKQLEKNNHRCKISRSTQQQYRNFQEFNEQKWGNFQSQSTLSNFQHFKMKRLVSENSTNLKKKSKKRNFTLIPDFGKFRKFK